MSTFSRKKLTSFNKNIKKVSKMSKGVKDLLLSGPRMRGYGKKMKNL